MLTLDLENGILRDPQSTMVFADRPYQYSLTGRKGGDEPALTAQMTGKTVSASPEGVLVTGHFTALEIEVRQTFRQHAGGLEETLTLQNVGSLPVSLDRIEIGFSANLAPRADWLLCAIPFRVQLDGSRHDYNGLALMQKPVQNAVFVDSTRKFMPPLEEEGCARSEAWAWGQGERGLVVIKYNHQEIELSVACPTVQGSETWLRFGGAGFCLYGEPSGARRLEPGQAYSFGSTFYLPYAGGLEEAFRNYRDFLDARGHTFPHDYNPPVNWNELYDVGWYHSRPEELKQFYTRQALLREAAKAKEVGCELLYLDPGWEVCEGTTLWDESRLGSVKSLVDTLKQEYGLGLGYRTILRTYQNYWPKDFLVRHTEGEYEPVELGDQYFWEVCACNPAFWEEKLKRILEISRSGVRFMMVDEFDWRGPCFDPTHQHPIPTTPLDHTMAVYRLCREIRRACPGLTIEAHDPVWPWSQSIYVPTYFQHGFGETGCYDENWGFEYMWDCLNDLKSGRALALYYYNLACNVPIYLHITMAADNDACVFFWWVASTVRHVGIGGKESSKTIEPPGGLPARDPEKRFAAYKEQMALYQKLKPYFVRGTFHGIAENAHLHTLADQEGGVLVLFNLTEAEQEVEFFVPAGKLNTGRELPVLGAQAEWSEGGVRIWRRLEAMSPAVVCVGEGLCL
jgi:hypothetical protein